MRFRFCGAAARAAAVVLFLLASASPALAVTKTWTNNNGTGDNRWLVAANWSPSGIPTSSDDVEIGVTDQTSNYLIIDGGAVAKSITIGNVFTNNPTVEVKNGNTLLISSASSVASGATLYLNNGILDGAGSYTVNGTLTFASGQIIGSGGLTIASTGALNFTGTSTCYLSRNVTNDGTITFGSTSANYYLYTASTITNNGLIDFQADEDLWTSGGGPFQINNQSTGIIRKSGGAGTTAIKAAVNNTTGATVESDSGTLTLESGSSSGDFQTSAGTVINIGGTSYTLSSGATVTGAGKISVSSTLNIASGADVTIPNLHLLTGSSKIDGTGTLRIGTNLQWDGGTMTGGGLSILQGTATAAINCSSNYCYLDNRQFNLGTGSTTAYTATTHALYFYNGGSLNPNTGATLNIQTDQDMFVSTGSGSIANSGTIQKISGAGSFIMNVPVTNTGAINALSGDMQFPAGVTMNGGSVSIGTTSNLDVTGNIFNVLNAFTVSGTGNFRVISGTLRVPTGVTQLIPRFTLGGGIVDGGGTLQISGTSTWSAGTMGTAAASGGTTEVVSGATLNITGVTNYTYLDQSRQLVNNGTVNYSSSVYALYLYNGADIVNNNTFDIQGDLGIHISGTGSVFTNNSTVIKSAGTGATGAPVNVEFDNTAGGTVSVMTGRLNLAGKGTSSGIFTTAAGAFLQITNEYDFAGTPTVNGSGTLRLTGSAHMIVPLGVTLAVPNLQFDAGYISGAGTVQITGTGTWTAGTMGHSTYPGGTTEVTGTGTLDIASTTYVYVDQSRSLVNNNVINYTSGTWGLWIYNSASLTNNGTFNYDSDIGIGTGGVGTLITNTGTILKDSGTGSPVISVPLNNTGLIQADTGTLFLGASGTHTGGDFTGNLTGAVGFSGGTHALDATSTLSGSGGITVTGGTVNVAGSYDPAKLNVSGGAINFNSNGTANILTLTNNGAIGGTGTFTILDDSTWTGGSMNGTGTTILDAGQTLTITAATSYCYIDTRTFTNNGTIVYSATTSNYHIYLYQGGVLNNAGTLNITDNQLFYGSTTTPVNNSGTITKNGGNGTTAFHPTLNNTGNVNVLTGTLSLVGNGTHTGSFSATSPAILAFGGGTHSLSAPGTISGTGTLAFTGGTVTSAVGYSVGTLKLAGGTATMNANGSADLLDMSSGTLGGSGTLTLNNGGTWTGGTMSGSGNTILPAGQTLAMNVSTSYPSLDTRTFTNNGTVNYTPTSYAYLQVYNNAVFANNNAFNLAGDQGIYGFSGGTFNNDGTFTRASGAGTAAIASIFNNDGSVAVSTGTLAFTGNGTHTGTFTIAAAATLNFAGGTHTAAGGFVAGGFRRAGTHSVAANSVTGSGTLGFTGANATFSIPYTVGALNITGGTATMNDNGSADAFTMSNGTFGGTGTFTATNGGTWTGGTMSGSGTTIVPATKTLTINPIAYCSLDGRTLTNNGTINYSPSSFPYLQVYNNGTLNNSGALNLTAGSYFYGYGGGTVNNSGTLTKSGTGLLEFLAILNNTGQVTVTNGTLSLNGGGTHTNGLFTSTAPGTIQFGGGTHSLSGTGSMSGTGAWAVTSGTTNVGVPYSLTSLAVSNGTINFNSNGSIGTLAFSNGTIGGTGTVSVTENSTWTGGAMTGSGTTSFAAAKTVTLGGASYLYIDTRTVQVNGTANYVPPSYYLQIYNNGILDVAAGATLNIQTDLMIYGYSGGTIDNNGTIARTTGSGNTTLIYPIVNNDGAINVTTGGLGFQGGGTHNGTFTATTPAVFEFQAGTQTFNAASTLGGTGRYRFTGGTSTVNGTWGMPIDVAGGTLILNTNGSTSTLNMLSGVLGGTGNVTVTGNSSLGGGTIQSGGTLTLDTGVITSMPGNSYLTLERSLLNKGTMEYTAPSYYFQLNGATVTNDGTFDVQTDTLIYAYGTSPMFQNNGTLKKTAGAGSMQFSAPLSNDGLVQVASGTMYFSNTYVQGSGTTELVNNATLQTTTLDLNGGSLIGNGTVQGHVTSDGIVGPGASAGSLTITGNYTQSATGALNIEIGGTTAGSEYDRLVVTGSVTLDGALNISAINSFLPATGNTFQILTFGSRPGSTDFASKNGLDLGSGTNLIPAYSATDLQLTTNTVQTDLSIAMTSTPATVDNGQTFTYNVTVTNGGGSNASGVAVSATLPATVSFASSSPAICSGSAPMVCTFGNIPNGGNAGVTITVQTIASGSAPLTATVSGSQFDPNGANNSASATTTITANADVSVTVTDTLDPVAAGSSAGYSIVVTNAGPDTATGVTLTTTPSSQLTFNSASAPCAGGFPCSLGNMAPGATLNITTSWSVVPTATGTASLGVNVSASSPTDLDSGDNSASQSTTIAQDADVQVVKTGPTNVPPEQGSTVTYTIVVTNNGPSQATGVSLDDPTPSGLTLQSVTGDCAAFPCAIGTMLVSETKTVQVTYAISGAVGTTFTNTATVTSGVDTNASNNSSSVTTTISNCPNTTITAPATVNGGSTANNASVTAIAGATYNWSVGNGVLTSGQGTSSITFTAGSGGSVSLSVTVTSGACVSTPTASVPIISADVSVTKTGPANVSSTAASSVTYSIVVTNNGPSTATGVTLSDPTPAGLTLQSVTGACAAFPCSLGSMSASASASVQATYSFTGQNANQVVTNTATVSSTTPDGNGSNNSSSVTTTIAACPTIVVSGPTAMEPNTSSTASANPIAGATYNWSITNGTIDGGHGTNTISFTTGTAGTTTLSVTVIANACTRNGSLAIPVTSTQADVYVVKSGPASVASGAQFSYTLTFGNNGPASAEDVFVVDTLPPGVSFVSDDSASCTGAATITCNAGILASGAEQTVTITVTAPTGPTSVTNTVQITTSSADPVNVNNTSTVTTSVNAPVTACPQTPPALISPNDVDANVSSPVTFSWSAVTDATLYELWIGPNAASLALNTTTGSTSVVLSLPAGSYAWQVIAKGASQSCNPQPSAIRTFTIPAPCPATAPTLNAPADGDTNVAPPVTFSWNAVPDATSYELWLGPNAASMVLNTTTAGTSVALNLPSGSYAWQVIAKGAPQCDAQPSVIRTFTIPVPCPATAPALTAPADGASFGNTTVNFSWGSVANATSYELWLGPDSNNLALNTTTAGTSTTLTLAAGTYAWQVVAKGDPSCAPQTSAVATFTITATVQCPANPPALAAPPDGASISGTSVTFTWGTVADATSYELWIGPDSGSLALNTATGGTSATVTLAAGTYAWQVIAKGDPSCNPQPSAIRTLTVTPAVQCPAAGPTLTGPENGANAIGTVTFTWEAVANATSYELWAARNNEPATLRGTTAGTSLTLAFNFGGYTWYVIAKGDPSCAPQTSDTRTFSILTIPPIPCPTTAPTLLLPSNGATNLVSPVTLSWTSVEHANLYELWLGLEADGMSLNQTTTSTTATLELSSGTYAWQVVAKRSGDGDCTPRLSNIHTFTIPELDTCGSNQAPTGLTPSNGETVASPVTFGWNAVANAIGYVVRIRVNGGALQDVGTTTGTTLTANIEAGVITFVVDALFSGCPPARSAEATFNVSQPAACEGVANPTAPVNGTNTTNASITFQWTGVAAATGYRVWMQTGGGDPEVLGETLGTSLTKTIFAGTHSWWVQTLYEGCPARDSQHFTVTVLPAQNCTGRGRPSLTEPANAVTVTNPNVTFAWSAVPDAIEYELWLAPAGGVPTLIDTTTLTSTTAEVGPGAIEWFVKAIFSGCPPTESDRRTLTYQPPANCADNTRPVLIAPAEGERIASPVSFDWNDVNGATGYDLFIDDQLVTSTTSSQASGINRPLGAGRWFVRAKFAQPCAALDSTESRFVVVPQVAACSPMGVPVIAAPGQISSGVQARVQWSFVSGATMYVLQMASDPGFSSPESINTDSSRQHTFELENDTNDLIAVYLRVHAIDTRCNPATVSPWSDTAIVYILPETGGEASSLIGEDAQVEYALPLGSELAGQTFTATPTTSWITVTPANGTVPAGGMNLIVTANTAGLPPGTNIGGVTITTGTAGRIRTDGTTTTTPFSVSLVSPVTPTPKSTPPPDALIIPAVANAAGINSQFQSDVRVSNTSAQVMKYQLTFIPTGDAGISAGRQTTFSIEPGRTIALDDVLKSWFGTGTTNAVGTLEVRPLTEVQKSTSSTPFGALANIVTFASSRTFNVTPNGTFGQHIPAIPFANFIGKAAGVLSLQQIAHSAQYRTNLGLVEGSGEGANLLIKVFNSDGSKLTEFPLTLNGGQHMQLNGFLTEHGVTSLNDGRVEVEVVGGNGKVTAYASVLDNATADPLLVSPVTLTEAGNAKWVMPGVADLNTGSANWQTDMRIFNAGSEVEQLTLAFHSMGGGDPKTTTMTLQPGEVKQLDRILANTFGVTQNGGAVHVTSADGARLIATARTYNQTTQGTYGQFISAVTPSEAVGVGSRPLQLLQVEESSRYRSNIGLAEVSGKPVTLEVSIVPPDAKFTASVIVDLAPNQFLQIPSMLAGLGVGEIYNARVTVRAVAGEGRATAYASVIDAKTNDPTYVPAQ